MRPKAAPIIMPAALSTALPRMVNSLNSFHIVTPHLANSGHINPLYRPQLLVKTLMGTPRHAWLGGTTEYNLLRVQVGETPDHHHRRTR
jgi:hypothetical protein